MNPTNARKTVMLTYLVVLGILFFGGLSQGNHIPQPKKFFGASVAYLGLSIGADFAGPVVVAFAIAFAFHILLQNTGSISGISKLTSSTPSTTNTGTSTTTNPVGPTTPQQVYAASK